jgi:DNA-binding NtrC family response regulator
MMRQVRACIFAGLVAGQHMIQSCIAQAQEAATHQRMVWLLGERGTGRNMLAHCLHLAGIHSEEPCVRLRCAAYQGMALQRELLGSFRRDGVVQRAVGGTLYLEDADFLSPWEYGLLVDMLSEMRDAPRIIISSSVDLRMQEEDWHWIELLGHGDVPEPLELPPLYARQHDVPDLAERLLWRMVMHAPLHETPKGIAPDLAEWMRLQHWPGNMVELRQKLRAALQHYRTKPNKQQLLEVEHFTQPLCRDMARMGRLQLLPAWLTNACSKQTMHGELEH